MCGRGRPRSADAQRGTVVVDGTTYEYVAHTNKDPSRWRLYFKEPGVDSLVGKRIEYLTWVGFPDGSEAKHWFAGLVEQVSDGTVRKGPRAKACHAAGFARILWDAQPALGEHEPTESWVALRPNKFNGDARCCWRLDLD